VSHPVVSDPAATSRRWPRRLLLLAGVVALVIVWLACLYWSWDREVRRAIAETDRIDPGWRFEEMEAVRADVPEAENSAVRILAARALMPPKWQPASPDGSPTLSDRLAKLPPPQRPDDADALELRAEMEKVAKAVELARQVADLPRGRHTVTWSNDLIGTLMPHTQDAREVAHLLSLDALRRALDGDGNGAVRSCRAAVNVGRSFGDEPTAISQLVRVACVRMALRALERSLALTEADGPSLEELQRLLADEAEAPLQLIAARSDRVAYFQALEVMRTGKLDRAGYGLKPGAFGTTGDDLMDRWRARGCEAVYLRYLNEVVEVAKLPTEEQPPRLKGLKPPPDKLPPLLEGLMRGGEWPKLAAAFHRAKADARCAVVALATERYRMAEGRWPASVNALVPRYLPAAPNDPFDGKPLRMRQLPDGILVYTVGADRQDDGGTLNRDRPEAPGTDLGFQLWDVGQRGKPAGGK
jgi:hypothetical protein